MLLTLTFLIMLCLLAMAIAALVGYAAHLLKIIVIKILDWITNEKPSEKVETS